MTAPPYLSVYERQVAERVLDAAGFAPTDETRLVWASSTYPYRRVDLRVEFSEPVIGWGGA